MDQEGSAMASRKQRRKAARSARKQRRPQTGPFRHPDGDRRHRGAMRVEDAIAIKRAMQQFEAPVLPDDPEADWEEE
jgi:hypothetical protein